MRPMGSARFRFALDALKFVRFPSDVNKSGGAYAAHYRRLERLEK